MLVALAANLVWACGPAMPSRLEPELDVVPGVIDGAVGSAQAAALLTETTLRCAEVEPLLGLDQTACEADYTDGPERAWHFVTLLSDADGRLHLIDAQVAGIQGAGRVDGFLWFFRDTVIARLTPALAKEPGLDRWLRDTLDGSGSTDVGSVHLEMDGSNRTLRLRIGGTGGG